MRNRYEYVIIGGGLCGAHAVEGIRELDRSTPILLIAAERHLPYDRPPLTKKLWTGAKKVEDVFVHGQEYYDQSGVDLMLGARAAKLDADRRAITDDSGTVYEYGRLLLATGGVPRVLPIPGGGLGSVRYYRTLDDYQALRADAAAGRTALVVGGGFIGSELAAALTTAGVAVTMIFPESWLCSRVFPEGLGRALQREYERRGVRLMVGDRPEAIALGGGGFETRTLRGDLVRSDIVVAGLGINPEMDLAVGAGLRTAGGIVVNDHLQTSRPEIFAAGDVAEFPYGALGRMARVEHWDNAVSQGKQAGRNMAGAGEAYTHMPYFFSDLFEFGYEAVGDVDTRLDVVADWQTEYEKGVLYYLDGESVRGAMMCNVWDKVDAARALIRSGGTVTPGALHGLIR